MFLALKGPDQAVPEAEREWGLHDEGPWDAGLQVCPDRARSHLCIQRCG